VAIQHERDRWAFSIEETARLLGTGRTLTYQSAQRGDIPTIRIGRRLLVPRQALEDLLSIGATAEGRFLVKDAVRLERAPSFSSRTSSEVPG
jgi:excisionase family DNA binding protein